MADLPDGELVHFIDLEGQQVNVMKSPDRKVCKIVGDAMKHALTASCDSGAFDALPRAEH